MAWNNSTASVPDTGTRTDARQQPSLMPLNASSQLSGAADLQPYPTQSPNPIYPVSQSSAMQPNAQAQSQASRLPADGAYAGQALLGAQPGSEYFILKGTL